jgi:integrase
MSENSTRRQEGHFEALLRMFHRFLIVRGYNIGITLDEVTGDTLRDFIRYLQEEHTFIKTETDKDGKTRIEYTNPRFKKAIQAVPESRMPSPRGLNTVCFNLQRFRTFYNWAIKTKLTTNNPFFDFESPTPRYGRPYYLTLDERRDLYNLDLSAIPRLAVQRDIFVFQCLIGCRVSDLRSLTKDSVINGAVEYIPKKTKNENPETVRVPLNETAVQILERYKDIPGRKLLPCISDQKYNEAIKELFTVAGLTRMVTVLNTRTREEEKRPLNEIASSHLARRTFIGNLYKRVKDPNLIGALSGHVKGSRAFARYHDIDEEMKRELVTMLD